jgi:hypothetical protein
MHVRFISQRQLDNPFERAVLARLQDCTLVGVASNNVLIPQIRLRNLPNEQDLVVLTRGRVYTLDAKALKAGHYRGASGGDWEYSRDGIDWKTCKFMAHPQTIAVRKGNAVESFVRENLPKGCGMPEVVAVIVVPDEANVEQLGWRDGTNDSSVRLLRASLSDLCRVLEADSKDHPHQLPSIDDLAGLFSIDSPRERRSLPCFLDEHLRVDAFLARLQLPVLRHLYRGYLENKRRAVRIEILPKFNAPETVAEQIRAFRNNVLALQELKHEAILRLYGDDDTPTSLVVVSELFSETTLQDLIDEQRRLTWDEARQVFRPVVDLMHLAHANSIVHRYLDPTCILVKEGTFAEVRVQGFFGAVVGGLTTVRGGKDNRGLDEQEDVSNPYLAPERTREEGRRGPMQDAYSVGRCLAAVLTGSPMRLPLKETPLDVIKVIGQLVSWLPQERVAAWTQLPALLA